MAGWLDDGTSREGAGRLSLFSSLCRFRLIFNASCILAMCLLGCAHSNQPEAKTDSGIIAWYQTYVSPVDGDRCPMTPSCSSYAQQAVQKHGVFWGWIMTCDRLIRCGRDETRLSPHVAENNRVRVWDPVWMNDFWWINEGAGDRGQGAE